MPTQSSQSSTHERSTRRRNAACQTRARTSERQASEFEVVHPFWPVSDIWPAKQADRVERLCELCVSAFLPSYSSCPSWLRD